MSRFAIPAALAVALALAGTASAANSAADCKVDYDAAVWAASTKKAKCTVLVAYSKCLGEFPRDSTVEMELVTKNEKACEAQWKEVGTPQVRTKRGDLSLSVDDAKDIAFHRHRRETINVFDMNEDLVATKKELAASKVELTAAKKAIADKSAADAKTLEATVAAAIKKLEDSTKTSIDKVNSDAADAQAKFDATIKQVKADAAAQAKQAKADAAAQTKSMEQKLKDSEAKSNKAVATLSTKVDVDVKKSIDDVKKGLADVPVHMWSGYPKNHNRGQNWHNFLLDYEEINTLSPYAQKVSGTHFKVLKNGIYKFEANLMTHTNNRCWAHYQINIGGQWINDATHTYAYSWKQSTFTLEYPVKAGQTIYSRVYAQPNCGNPYVWHQGKHSRFQMWYVGQYGSKCQGPKCTI